MVKTAQTPLLAFGTSVAFVQEGNMSLNRASLDPGSRRGLKISLLAALTLFIALGALIADTLTKQRDSQQKGNGYV
jgi:hypothetical protein